MATTDTAKLITDVLDAMKVGERVKPGAIIVDSAKFYTDSQEALEEFLAFGGEGWLCTADSAKILRLPTDKAIISTSSWPRYGELASDGRSLHLCYNGESWSLSQFSEDIEADGLLLESTLLAGSELLRYRVSHTPLNTNDQPFEYRPHLCRFLGFAEQGGSKS